MKQVDVHIRPIVLMIEVAKQHRIDVAALAHGERERLMRLTCEFLRKQPSDDTRASRLRTMLRMFDEYAGMVADWHWDVLAAPEPVLISGDAPVVTIEMRSPGWSGLLPKGLADLDAAQPEQAAHR